MTSLPMGEWRSIQNLRELDVLVEKLLGWTVVYQDHPNWRPARKRYFLCWPSGTVFTHYDFDSEVQAWASFADAEDENLCVANYYTTDPRTDLPLRRFCWWTFMSPGEGSVGTLWTAEIWDDPNSIYAAETGYGKTLAEARVRCWLAWKTKS